MMRLAIPTDHSSGIDAESAPGGLGGTRVSIKNGVVPYSGGPDYITPIEVFTLDTAAAAMFAAWRLIS